MPLHEISSAVSGALLGYGEKTSATSITATTEGTANTIATATAVALDGLTRIRIEAGAPSWVSPSAVSLLVVLYAAKDGGAAASLGFWASYLNATASTAEILTTGGALLQYLTPAAGSWVYSLRAYVTSGTGTVNAGAGGAPGAECPAFIAIARA